MIAKDKQLRKIVLHLKITLARPNIHDRALPEMLSPAFPCNPVGITKPSSILLFLQPDKKFMEEPTKFKGTYFLTTLGKKSKRKIRSHSKLASKLLAEHIT